MSFLEEVRSSGVCPFERMQLYWVERDEASFARFAPLLEELEGTLGGKLRVELVIRPSADAPTVPPVGSGPPAAICTLVLDEAPTVGLDGYVSARRPRGALAIREALRFYSKEDVAALDASPCRTYTRMQWFANSPAQTPAELRAQVELLTLFLAHTVIWTDVQVDADSVIGTYEYRPWEPDGNNRRKGLAIIKLRGDEAYYYLQETDQRYWDSVAGTFRASAATLRVDPPAGG